MSLLDYLPKDGEPITSHLSQKLDAHFVDVNKKLSFPPVAISIGEHTIRGNTYPTPFGTYGNFSAIVGPSKSKKTFLKSLLIESLIYLVIVLSLNYLEAGIHGLIHGKNFLDSMGAFGQANPLKVLAMSIVYWLIVWPYLIFTGMKLAMGKEKIMSLFFGDRNQANH